MNFEGSAGVVAQHVRQEDPVCAAVRDAEARADRVGQRVADADEGVGEREAGDRGGVGHRGARLEVVAVGKARGSASKIRLTACMQNASVYGEAKIDTAGLERVGQRVDAGVGGDRRRQRERQPRVDDRHVGHQRVVDERHLAPRRW